MVKKLKKLVSKEEVEEAFEKFTEQLDDIDKKINSILAIKKSVSPENVEKLVLEVPEEAKKEKEEELVEIAPPTLFDKHRAAKELNDKISKLKEQQKRLETAVKKLDDETTTITNKLTNQFEKGFKEQIAKPLNDYLFGKTKKGIRKISVNYLLPLIFNQPNTPEQFTQVELDTLNKFRKEGEFDKKKLEKFQENVLKRIKEIYDNDLKKQIAHITTHSKEVQKSCKKVIEKQEKAYDTLYKITSDNLTQDMIDETTERLTDIQTDLKETLEKMKAYRNSIRSGFFWLFRSIFYSRSTNRKIKEIENLLDTAKKFKAREQESFLTAGILLNDLKKETDKHLENATKRHKETMTFEYLKKESLEKVQNLIGNYDKNKGKINDSIIDLDNFRNKLEKFKSDDPKILDYINENITKFENLLKTFNTHWRNTNRDLKNIESMFNDLFSERFQKMYGDEFDRLTAFDPNNPDEPPLLIQEPPPEYLVTDEEKTEWYNIRLLLTGFSSEQTNVQLTDKPVLTLLKDAKTEKEKEEAHLTYDHNIKSRVSVLKRIIKARMMKKYLPNFQVPANIHADSAKKTTTALKNLISECKTTLEKKDEPLEKRQDEIINTAEEASKRMEEYKKTWTYRILNICTFTYYSKRVSAFIKQLEKDVEDLLTLESKHKPISSFKPKEGKKTISTTTYSRSLQELEKKAKKHLKKAKGYYKKELEEEKKETTITKPKQ